jgi:hypothetical protein
VSVTVSDAVRELRSPQTIRKRCHALYELALAGRLEHFAIATGRLDEVAKLVARVTRERYPTLAIPPHSRFGHFDAGGVKRLAALEESLSSLSPRERARRLVDVVLTSVLLDAGAGARWAYREADSGLSIGRSEGLAVASLAWVRSGGLSSHGRAYEVDAGGLQAASVESLSAAFQVSEQNPLVGVEGRVHLLRELGRTLEARPDVFGTGAQLGGLVDFLATRRAIGTELAASAILETLLDALGGIWPGRLSLDGVPLGDVWRHPSAGGDGATRGMVPLHKLSQWLSYSLIHPLEVAGLTLVELDALTGLAEYRNGGLFLDGGVLVPRHPGVLEQQHEVGSEVVVEWRALTVALLDQLAPRVRAELGEAAAKLPLAAILEGGTWAAGRELARSLRSDGAPPLHIVSDGTVF